MGAEDTLVEEPRVEEARGRAGEDPPRRRIGSYEVLELIGGGNMGEVYRSWDPQLERTVAIKLVPPGLAVGAAGRERFAREARLAARVRSPHAVQVLASGVEGDLPFLVMECVEGRSLEMLLRTGRSLDAARACRIAAQAARGLQAAHRAGLVHRDVKPASLLITPAGEVKVAGFGLARRVTPDASLAAGGDIEGTPLYLSPEQALGERVDHRSDMYSLGITLYHMVAGEPPFRGRSPLSVLMRHVREPLPRLGTLVPGVPGAVEDVVERLAAKRPDDRYPTWDDAVRALERAAEEARPAAMGALGVRKLRLAWCGAAGALAVLALVSLRAGGGAGRGRPDPVPLPVATAAGEPWSLSGHDLERPPGGAVIVEAGGRLDMWQGGARDAPARLRVELEVGAALGGRLELTVRDRDSGRRYGAILRGPRPVDGGPPATRGGPSRRPIPGPRDPSRAALVSLEPEPRVIAGVDRAVLQAGRRQTLVLEQAGGRLRLLAEGELVLDAEAPGIAAPIFGLSLIDMAGRLASVSVESGP